VASARGTHELIVGIAPGDRPDGWGAVDGDRCGALDVLDVGTDVEHALSEMQLVAADHAGDFGVRVTDGCDLDPARLPRRANTVVVGSLELLPRFRGDGRRVLVEVTSLGEARSAAARGADGLIARIPEAPGQVDGDPARALLERLAGAVDLPIWLPAGAAPSAAVTAPAGAPGHGTPSPSSSSPSLLGPCSLAGVPVAIVGGGGDAAGCVRDVLLGAGAAVAAVAAGAPLPPGTRHVVDLTGLAAGAEGADETGGADDGGSPGLDPGAVVLVAGGARGIGAEVALGLARAFGCGLELAGRSSLPPGVGAAHLAGRDGPVAVRHAVLRRDELGRPGEIAAEPGRILAVREIRRTLAAVAEHATFAGYRALDARDPAALAAAVDDVRATRGRCDGVVHVWGMPGAPGGPDALDGPGTAPGDRVA
jgi:hypothetical protein